MMVVGYLDSQGISFARTIGSNYITVSIFGGN